MEDESVLILVMIHEHESMIVGVWESLTELRELLS